MRKGAKHIHEAHGEKKLMFDEADSIWERVMETNGSAGGLLRMAFSIHWWNTFKEERIKHFNYTQLVDPSIGWYSRAL
jgi:hypothetical protein